MNRSRFIQGLKGDIQLSEKGRRRIIRKSLQKYSWKTKCTVAMEEFAELQQLIILIVLYICAYSLVDRICKCIEHCALAKGYAKLEEAKILAKDRSKGE